MKKLIRSILERYAAKLLQKYQPKVITVTGSVGKTSTKNALATVLKTQYKVLVGKGNYNVDVSVPVMLFGLDYPAQPRNPLAWLSIFWKMHQIVQSGYDYDVVILELGADTPGDIDVFARYIHPDIAVVTAISIEHMESFGTLEAAAREEMVITSVSKVALINRDDIDVNLDHLSTAQTTYTYGLDNASDFQFVIDKFSLEYGFDGKFFGEGLGELPAQVRVVGKHALKPAIAAVAVAAQLGVSPANIAKGVADIAPIDGRMNLLRGAENSIIIDDSYNSTPLATEAAIKALQEFEAPSRVAILGSMNELGEYSVSAHTALGELCDPAKLDLVVTVGDTAEQYLAAAAKKKGCKVESYKTPYDAGAAVRAKLKPGVVVLVKGSQNGIFTEEAVKLLLANPADTKYLVRQSPYWQKVKHEQFGR